MRTIPELKEGTHRAKATGTLPNGKPVVVNLDGTVSVVAGSAASVGSETNFESGQTSQMGAVYDVNANRVVIFYRDIGNSYYGTAVVGTISGTSISFGSPVVFQSNNSQYSHPVYDESAQKIVNYYSRDPDNYGMAIVGTVSGTSISFGSATVYKSAQVRTLGAAYASNTSRSIVVYRNEDAGSVAKGVSGGVSGTGISFGSEESVFSGSTSGDGEVVAGKNTAGSTRLLAFISTSSASYAMPLMASGTNVYQVGAQVEFVSAKVNSMKAIYDDDANSFLIVYRDGGNSDKGTVKVGSLVGTTTSFGSAVTFSTLTNVFNVGVTYNSSTDKAVIAYRSSADSNKLYLVEGQISGTSITFDATTSTSFKTNDNPFPVYNSSTDSVAVAFADVDNSNVGEAFVYSSASTNLTSENYIGMSQGVVSQTGSSGSTGSEVVFDGNSKNFSGAYDTTNNKVLIVYRDVDNSSQGTAIVGTVSGSSISFGSAAVFETQSSLSYTSVSFDSTAGKFLIAYRDGGNSNYGTAIVATISGTSVSFGTPAVFESANSIYNSSAYDASNSKIVIAYRDAGNSDQGTAVVATISGTSVSFGTPVVFETGEMNWANTVYDSSNNKIVIAYSDGSNGDYITAIVGTVSGTSISFGSATAFAASSSYVGAAFDSTNNKVVIVYRDNSSSSVGVALVGTVSGTSISFGSPVTFTGTDTYQSNSVSAVSFDTDSGGVLITYEAGVDRDATAIRGVVSGTSISFGTAVVLDTGGAHEFIGNVYDPDQNKNVVFYKDSGNSNYATALVFKPDTIATTRGQVNAGSSATVDIIGSLSTNQGSLTAGQQYFVQTDGTIGTTAGNPSVLAGTAISSTSLVVKT